MFHGAGQPLKLNDFPIPAAETGEAVVRITCCTVCGSDLHTISGKRKEPVPSILGHEILGTVSDVGTPPLCDVDGRPLRPGDRITWSTCICCGHCDRCRQSLPQKCRTVAKYGHEQATGRFALSGGLAEYLLLRAGSTVIRVPAGLPDEVACPVNCATATIAAAYRMAGTLRGQRVLVLGAGLLGLTAAAFAKASEAAVVVISDPDAARLKTAENFGADRTVVWQSQQDQFHRQVADITGTPLFDIVLELSGSPDAVEAACRFGDVGAHIILVGTVMGSRPVQLDPERIVRYWLRVKGVHNYAPEDLRTAVTFLNRFHTRFPFHTLVEASFSLTDVNDAINYALQNRPVRVAVRP